MNDANPTFLHRHKVKGLFEPDIREVFPAELISPQRPIQDEFRGQPRVLARCRPDERRQVQVLFVEKQGVEKITDLLPPRHCQNLVGRGIPKIQPPPQIRIRLDGEKPKHRVLHPFHFCLRPRPRDHRASMLRLHAPDRLDLKAGRLQHRHIRLVGRQQQLRRIMKNIHVLGAARRILRLMQHGRAADEAVGIAVRRQHAQHFALEMS